MMRNKKLSLQKIVIAVFTAHIVALVFLLPSFKKKESLKKIIVYEKQVQKKEPLPKKQPLRKPLPPQKKHPLVNKKQSPKKLISPQKKKTSYQSTKIQPKQNIFTDLEKSLDVLAKHSVSSKTLVVPKMVQLKIEKKPSSTTMTLSYEKDLIQFLQNVLEFKEVGEVSMEITIEETGKLSKCKTLYSKSNENENYLKNRLHKLNFPCFNAYDISEKQLTFVVTFCND